MSVILARTPDAGYGTRVYLGPEAEGRFWAIWRSTYGARQTRVDAGHLLKHGVRIYVRPNLHSLWIGPVETEEQILEFAKDPEYEREYPSDPEYYRAECYVCPPKPHRLSKPKVYLTKSESGHDIHNKVVPPIPGAEPEWVPEAKPEPYALESIEVPPLSMARRPAWPDEPEPQEPFVTRVMFFPDNSPIYYLNVKDKDATWRSPEFKRDFYQWVALGAR